MFAVQAAGREISTVEGLAQGAQLHAIQTGFHEEHGLQCGFCTPGMMLTSVALLAENPSPTEEEIRWALSGNVCRCTGYQNIVKAVQHAAAALAEEGCVMATVEPRGLGHSVKRLEDGRFLRGRGNYVDDITLPNMLHMELLRSPVAHARIKSIDTSRAAALPGVVAVVTGELMAQHNLAWMPTLSGDTQAVLVTDKVRFQGQEIAAVVAESAYIARDALELIDVDYEILPAITSPQQALADGAPVIRDDKDGQTNNHIYDWETGDKEATDRAFAEADKVVSLDTFYPRCHPAPLECCGCVADVNPATGKATIYMTSQAPHAHRTLFAIVAGLPEHQIRIVSPDIGGGFGNKVPIYPGYVVATAASLLIGQPVKWIEDRFGNLISTGFARDYHMRGELAIKDGRMTGLRASLLSDNGAFFADAQPSRFKAGLFHICTGSYDIPAAHVTAVGAYTNKAPGGVAYRCSFRVTEASYLIERLVQTAAYELGVDPADFRTQNFIKPEQFPYTSATGFEYDSGDYGKAHDLALEKLGYTELRKEQEAARAEGRLIGIGVASFTEVVGAGPGKTYDIAGLRMFDSAELRIHPTGKAILKLGDEVAGPGPRDDLRPDRRRGARHPGRARAGRGGRHRHDALRPRHVRQPIDADQRRRDGHDRAQAARQGAHHRRAPARGVRGRPRVGERGAST